MADQASPSLAAIAVASGILGLVAGYFLGSGSSIGLFDTTTGNPRDAGAQKSKVKKSWPNNYDVDVQAGSDTSDEEFIKSIQTGKNDSDADEDLEEEDDDKELKGFEGSREEVKLMLAVRTDLGMTKGKIAAQCGHATLACYKALLNHTPSTGLLKRWENNGQPKIAVQVKSEEELMTLQALAQSLGLCARVIHDAGRTQIAAGSATVLGVLGPKSVVDQVTGQLKLL